MFIFIAITTSKYLKKPTSQVGYHAGKPIESVVYCFYKITFCKKENKKKILTFCITKEKFSINLPAQ